MRQCTRQYKQQMTTATENSHNAQPSTSMIEIRHYRVHEDKEVIRSDEIRDLESKMKNVEFMTLPRL
jgi:citrate lyase synthetase